MLAVEVGRIIQRLTGNPMAVRKCSASGRGVRRGADAALVPGNAFGWLLPAGSLVRAATLLVILIAAGRGGFSPHRYAAGGDGLSTAFTMLLMMLQASGRIRDGADPDTDFRLHLQCDAGAGGRSGVMKLIPLALAPLAAAG